MSYQVLARKWRPRHFQAMVGQEHILQMLTNALKHQRLHHAYLFTGTRGVGKTTLARILAKCLNCETGITASPCNQCNACQSIDSGRFLDLIEIDAASRTKVEDTRELLDNVPYSPSQGRYKIYLIDEVHMLSNHSFNALLKTLEEPPSHVKFLLATTDPKRLPITILSRCLQFNLKRVPLELISKHLQHICQIEKFEFEIPALTLIANAADGSMRDALSLLDQAIAFCNHKLTSDAIKQMLGSIEQDLIYQLLSLIADHDGQKLLEKIAQLAEFVPNYTQALEAILTTLHQIAIAQTIPLAPNVADQVKQLATRFSAEEVQLYYQIALIGQRDLSLAPNPSLGFEMILLRMLAFQPVDTAQKDVSVSSSTQVETTGLGETKFKAINSTNWLELLPKLKLTGLAYSLAANCTLNNINEHQVELTLNIGHQALLNAKLTERIEQALINYFNKPIKLEIKTSADALLTPAKQQQDLEQTRQINAKTAIENDVHVKQLMETFNATLDVNSIKAVDDK